MKNSPPKLLGRKTIFLMFLLATIAAGAIVAGCSKSQDTGSTAVSAKTLYTCGMHPQVVQDHPGNCPICGMKLTPVHQQTAANTNEDQRAIKYYKSTMMAGEVSQTPGEDSMGMDMVAVYEDGNKVGATDTIALDSQTIQNMNVRTAAVTRGPLRRTIRAVGVIDYDETTLGSVATKFKGWIEKLSVGATGQLVMRGDPLFEIYSPDLYSAQVEYLLATASPTNAGGGGDGIRSSALTKLKFYDISDQQIAELDRTRQPQKTLRILAPQDGFVIEKDVVEGQMVDSGMQIYRLADLGLVWVRADIYEQDLAYLKLGQETTVTLSYLPDREFRGRVTYIYPNVDEKTRTVRVRMEFHNPGYFLKPGMFATVQVASELAPSVLLIPDMAVLRSGEKTTVFVVLDGGKFEPRTVALGPEAENDQYQVLRGLSEGERIVTSGQFMLDSESQLREAIQKMRAPGQTTESQAAVLFPASGDTNAAPSTNAGIVKYICPMPEHVSVEYDHPGQCPICGMTLVPVSPEMLLKLQPGGKILYYTCPMPEHSDAHYDKPGKCPKCGMTLIPIMEAPAATALTNQPASQATSDGGMAMPDHPN
jgi:membrane fusion protein, copper/silver efflux system